jgi:glycosyltransferase involved in cell wall biosynthesis
MINRLRSSLGKAVMRLQGSCVRAPRSGNFVPSRWSSPINASESDVVHLHWIGNETISIEDVARIRKPVVWTLHDMWTFCGTEHVEPDDARWAPGYQRANRRSGDFGLDLDLRVWQRKRAAWRGPMQIVTPSAWLAQCAKRSALLSSATVTVIPNVVATDTFMPRHQVACRAALKLPQDDLLILFGAIRADADANKGYDLLIEALSVLDAKSGPRLIRCVIFGQSAPDKPLRLKMPVHWMGHIDDESQLATLYGAADVMVVPSRVENLPQTATEAQACGCPVVAFRTSGLPDAVEDRATGYLAQPYDSADLARGILWVTENTERTGTLRRDARLRALRLWRPSVIVPQYVEEYRRALERASIPIGS